MPPPPGILPNPPATLSTNSQDVATYASTWRKSETAYNQGKGKDAVASLNVASNLNDKLSRSLQIDSQWIEYAIGRSCWTLQLPACARSKLSSASKENLGQASHQAQLYVNSLEPALFQYHYEYAAKLKGSLWSYRFLADAQCHAKEAENITASTRNSGDAFSSSFLLASIYAMQGRRGLACRTYGYGNAQEMAQVTAAEKNLGCTDKDYSFWGDPLDFLQKDEVRCTEPDDRRKPSLSKAPVGSFESDLYADALHKEQAGNEKDAWRNLMRIGDQLRSTTQALEDDRHKLHLSLANADVLAGDNESAIPLYAQWLKEETRSGASTLSDTAQQVGQTLAVLQASLSYQYYNKAAADQAKGNWQPALNEFSKADSYWPHPEDDLGIAASELHLYTGCSSAFVHIEFVPSHLENAYAAYQEYLRRLPNATNRDQVEATMKAIQSREHYCDSGQEIADAINMFLAAKLLGFVNSVNASFPPAAPGDPFANMWNDSNSITVMFGDSPSAADSTTEENAGGSSSPPVPATVGNVSPNVQSGAPVPVATSGTITVTLPNISMSPVIIAPMPQSSVSPTPRQPLPAPGGTIVMNPSPETGIPVPLPPSMLNQATWSWSQGSYAFCEGIGLFGGFRVNAEANGEPTPDGGRRITRFVLWVYSASFSQETPIISAQIQVRRGTVVLQTVNLTYPDVPSLVAAPEPYESSRQFLPTNTTLIVPPGGILHLSVSVLFGPSQGACTGFSSNVDINPFDGSVH
jgi:tetratricopeptide (TPR) repeat protein